MTEAPQAGPNPIKVEEEIKRIEEEIIVYF
jgi:hypothetical protein